MKDSLSRLGLALTLFIFLIGLPWLASYKKALERAEDWRQKSELLRQQEAGLHTEKAHREYVLEVISLGVTVEKYRQGKLWDILQAGTPYKSIRETDPRKYPWQDTDKIGVGGGRACDALENGAKATPMYWGVPSFYAGSPILETDGRPSVTDPIGGLAESATDTGMAWHLFVTAPWQLSERPDRLLEKVFDFFDEHPDLPYAVLMSEDSMGTRDSFLPTGMPSLVKDGYYIPEMPDSSAVIVLARRERVEPLRPFVWADANNDFVQDNLRREFIKLENSVPTMEKAAHPEKKIHIGRMPTVAEWLPVAAAFTKRPRATNADASGLRAGLKRFLNHPPTDWKPTPWFPIPWNRDQLNAFDGLPSLGYLHRPTFVTFADAAGQPVTGRERRQQILEAGLQQALQTLPEAERARGPARIIAAMGNNAEQSLALEGALHNYAKQGGPHIDTARTAQFINTDRRLGNTGAATLFVQMALGVMGSYRDGGVSAAINLRDPSEASIVFISPPTEARRKAQEHRPLFRHQVEPAINPENYRAPSVEAIVDQLQKKGK